MITSNIEEPGAFGLFIDRSVGNGVQDQGWNPAVLSATIETINRLAAGDTPIKPQKAANGRIERSKNRREEDPVQLIQSLKKGGIPCAASP
jgi:hypothetical protein